MFVINVKRLKSELFVVTRFYIVNNATEYEFLIIKTPLKEIDNKKHAILLRE